MQLTDSAVTPYVDKFHFYKNDLFIGASIKKYGEYCQQEINMLLNYIDGNSVVYDIGANIGYHTTAFASVAKQVYCFEPNASNYTLLELNTKSFQNVVPYNVACGDEITTKSITEINTLAPGNYGKPRIVSCGQECFMVTLDYMMLPAPTLVKIDTEGYEENVIQGMKRTIEQSNPVILYEAPKCINALHIHEFLLSLGYNLYWMPIYNFNVDNFNGDDENIFANTGVINFFAVPKNLKSPNLMPYVLNETLSDLFSRMRLAGKVKIKQ